MSHRCWQRGGRLRKGSRLKRTAKDYCGIDFAKVYHDRAMPEAGREEWKDARHAEVLVRSSLSLDHLRWIYCRSAPERDTLLYLLKTSARKRWEKRILLEGARRVFYKRGTFVERVLLTPTRSRFDFFLGGEWRMRGPYHVRAYWKEGNWGVRWEGKDYYVSKDGLRVSLPDPQMRYTVHLYFDDNLIYANRYVHPTKAVVA